MLNQIGIKDITGNIPVLIASMVLVLLLLTAAIGPFLVHYHPEATDLDNLKQPPGRLHLLGTDSIGRDIM